jgi:hypothetical protein
MTPIEKLKKIREEIVEMATKGAIITILCKDGKLRNYKIKDYAKLCVYTEASRAQAKATVNIAMEYDSDLIQVSDHNTTTPQCELYEGKVFSISGKDPDFPYYDDFIPVHPNCKHTITITFREIIEKYGVEKYK